MTSAFLSPSKFNIVSTAVQTQRILCVCVCIAIDAMLNYDGDVDIDTYADVKCEQNIRYIHT